MSRRNIRLWDYLQEKGIVRTASPNALGEARDRLNDSGLLAAISEIAQKINSRAGNLVVEPQTYLPPEPLVYSLTFHDGRQDHALQIELWDSQPQLVFVSRVVRGASAARWLGPFYRLFSRVEIVTETYYRAAFDPDYVSPQEIESWLMYLLSGLDRAFIPSAARTPPLAFPNRPASSVHSLVRGTGTR